jgi:hypothetical protein
MTRLTAKLAKDFRARSAPRMITLDLPGIRCESVSAREIRYLGRGVQAMTRISLLDTESPWSSRGE